MRLWTIKVEVTWEKLEKAVLSGIEIIRNRIPECLDCSEEPNPNPNPLTVGILASSSDSPTSHLEHELNLTYYQMS